MISTWIAEIMLHEIVALELSIKTPHTTTHTTPHTTPHTASHTTPHTAPHTNTHSTEMSVRDRDKLNAEERSRSAREIVRSSKVSNFKDFLRKHK